MLGLSGVRSVKGHNSVFQYLRHLENKYKNEKAFLQNLQLKADLSLNFPSRDYSVINQNDKNISLNFMALIGVDGCLPNYFNEILCSNESKDRLQDFLDIFHHHIYLLFYKAWKSQRPDVLLEFDDKKWLSMLKNMMPRLNVKTDPLSFSPQLLCNKKTPFSLAKLVYQVFPKYICKILPSKACWQSHGLSNSLNDSEIILGENSLLGDKFLRTPETIHIHFASLSKNQFKELNRRKQYLLDVLSRYIDIFQTIKISAEVNYEKPSLVLGKDLIKVDSSLCLTGFSYQIKFQVS